MSDWAQYFKLLGVNEGCSADFICCVVVVDVVVVVVVVFFGAIKEKRHFNNVTLILIYRAVIQ